jgi:hypothetical protein
LLIALWLLAGRWGRQTPSGVALRLPLSHETLGSLVGAKRSSVTLALKALELRGCLERPRRGEVVLVGEAPGAARATTGSSSPAERR